MISASGGAWADASMNWQDAVANREFPRDRQVAVCAVPMLRDRNGGGPGGEASVLWRESAFAPWRGRIARGSFASNVLCMVTGTAFGQATSVILAPVLTRLYAPDQFGYLSVYTAVLSICAVVAALGFDLAIPIAASEVEMANLLAICGAVLVSLTGLASLLAGLVSQRTLEFLWLGPLASYRYLIPIGFVCLGGYYVAVAAATRVGAFREIAATRVSQGITGPVSQIGLGLLGFGTPGLALGFVLGQSSGTVLLFLRVFRRNARLVRAVTWDGVFGAARRYVRFPLLASWARLLDTAGAGTILFVLFSACFSSEIAGYMFLTERVIARPLLILSTSLLQVYTGEAGLAVQQDPELLRRRFWQVIPHQLLLSSAWILLANLMAGWAFPILFGQQWHAAIPYLHALSAAYLALAVLHPVSTSLQLLERQMLAATWQVGRLVLVVASVVMSWQLGLSAVTTLWIASFVQATACVVMLALIAVSIERRIEAR